MWSDTERHIAVRVEQLGKRYELGAPQARYRTLREAVTTSASGLLSRARRRSPGDAPTLLWALQDVSLSVPRGKAVGVIGRNGSGKSTLLKVLSRVTAPTVGRVEVRGRVGTLLEIGTGFHNELTGRENIFLSGAILGMRRSEISRRFDEIVDFAGVERFIDTPVKRYSSGMYMRLAFAVAAHLEPHVLLVDEVLAVGDAAFQRKCLGRMSNVADEGRTVLFVSHDVDAVQRLCSHCVLLDEGRVVAFGPAAEVVRQYLASPADGAGRCEWIELRAARRSGSGEARFTEVRVSPVAGRLDGRPCSEGPLELTLAIESDVKRTVGSLAVSIESLSGTKLIEADIVSNGIVIQLAPGMNRLRFRIAALHLNPGLYSVRLWLGHTVNSGFDHIPSAFQLEVIRPLSADDPLPVTAGAVPCRFDVVPA
jgi:lipopolysaccharide transport system ATP-binding protein